MQRTGGDQPLRGKKVLITGGAGFVGLHLIEELLRQGCHDITSVDTIDDYPKKVKEQIKTCASHLGGRGSYRTISFFIKNTQPDVIFHLAAGNLETSLAQGGPARDAETTILGTLYLLEAIRYMAKKPYPLIVFSSSGSVYGEPVQSPQTEDHPRVPTSPYGVSKMAAEEYLRVWNHLFGIPFVGLRYYNVYGSRQKNGVIPTFAEQILDGKPVSITGNGLQSRCFTHVSDVVRATIMVAKDSQARGKFYNIASPERISILRLATKMMDVARKEVPIIPIAERAGEIMKFNPLTSLAYHDFGYKPSMSLDKGLERYFAILRGELI